MATRNDDQVRALRTEAMEHVQRLADRRLDDTRFDALRPLRARRVTIVAWAVVVLAAAAVTLLDVSLLTVLAVGAAAGATWLLRAVVRAVVDLPDEVLDERQVARRDHAYRLSYQFGLSAISLALVVAYVAADASVLSYDVRPAHVNALFVATFLGGLGLPSAVFGWGEPEI